jgi:succinyl-CoA synthetase beta subunit
MRLFEFQAKAYLRRHGVPVPRGVVISSARDLDRVRARLPKGPWVVKAQVLAGGRGKSGGILVCKTPRELEEAVRGLLGSPLVQEGFDEFHPIIRKLLIEDLIPHDREFYLAVTLDRETRWPKVLFSPEGGIEVENAARTDPSSILNIPLNPLGGFLRYRFRNLLLRYVPHLADVTCLGYMAESMARLLWQLDALLVEVNPMVLTAAGTCMALDAKIEIDENAFYRQPTLARRHLATLADPVDRRAARAQVSYVRLDGCIGCLVNGAGLAMATMDAIREKGGRPANFLDVGGGVDKAGVDRAIRILVSDPKVKAIFINIFGGIVHCDLIAAGLIAVLPTLGKSIPVVVRLQGTNKSEAVELLRRSKLRISFAETMDEGAALAVAAAGEC